MENTSKIVRFPVKSGECSNCALAARCLGKGLKPEEIKSQLNIKAQSRLLQRGDTLFVDGEPIHSLYAVRSGALKAIKTTIDGEEQITEFHLPGDVIGFSAIAEGHHTCRTMALDTTSVCAFSFADLTENCRMHARIQETIFKLLGQKLMRDQAFFLTLGSRDATQRVAAFLMELSKHYAEQGFSATAFTVPMSRSDMANYLSLAVETVSRIFSKLQRDSLVSTERNSIVINDLKLLGLLAGVSSPHSDAKVMHS